MTDPYSLPLLRQDRLIWQDTSRAPTSGGIYPCLLCEKPFVMGVFLGEPDQICEECASTYRDAARVICNKCRITIGRVVSKILDNGFYIRPRTVLHSNYCNVCRPGLNASTIMEIDEWQKNVRPNKIFVPMRR
jgi:hypothetical protein